MACGKTASHSLIPATHGMTAYKTNAADDISKMMTPFFMSTFPYTSSAFYWKAVNVIPKINKTNAEIPSANCIVLVHSWK